MTEEPGSADHEPVPTIAKPDELLALYDVSTEMFAMLRSWFDVPPIVGLDLAEVDSAVGEMGDPVMIAALAMRKLQALHLLSTPGVRTTTDVVVAIVNDLERALIQAPVMRLKRQAASTDWDRAFVDMEAGEVVDVAGVPAGTDDSDPEADHFRLLHARLHDAMFAVIEASEGEIRVLV